MVAQASRLWSWVDVLLVRPKRPTQAGRLCHRRPHYPRLMSPTPDLPALTKESGTRNDLFRPATDPDERRSLWIQVAIVLALAVIPDVFSVITGSVSTYPTPTTFEPWQWFSYIDRGVQVAAVLACVALLTRAPLRSIGLQRPRWFDVPLGALLFAFSWCAVSVSSILVVRILGHTESDPRPPPTSAPQWTLMVVADVFNAFGEELAIWGFLYTRLCRLWHPREFAPIAAAAACFASYHLYHGVDGALLVFIGGLCHGAFIHLTRRFWPLVLAHATTNVVIMLLA